MNRLRFLPLFIIFFVLALLLYLGSRTGILSPVTGVLETVFTPVERSLFALRSTQNHDQLKTENQELVAKLAQLERLEQDNRALHDQFQTDKIQSHTLLPATIIGAPGFLPGNAAIETYIIDKGKTDGIQSGQAIVYKDNVVGKISTVSEHMSEVILVTNKKSAFAAETSNSHSLGIVSGLGNEAMVLTNVVLSDKLSKGDIVVTKGDIDARGIGYPPGLVVGKVISIDKRSSALFQAGAVETLLDFSKLSTVFILTSYE